MTILDVRAQLPKVGDVRMEIPTIPDKVKRPDPQECIVIEVHPDRLWYRVRFTGSGFVECYKLPRTKEIPPGGVPW